MAQELVFRFIEAKKPQWSEKLKGDTSRNGFNRIGFMQKLSATRKKAYPKNRDKSGLKSIPEAKDEKEEEVKS